MRSLLRRYRWIVVLVVLAGAVSVIAGGPSPTAPLDPGSTEPDGTKALVLLLRHLGARVNVGSGLPSGPGVALVLRDRLNRSDRAELLRWVSGGNTLVLADPASPMAGGIAEGGFDSALTLSGGQKLGRAGCPFDLPGVVALQPEGGVLLDPHGRGTGCFGDRRGWFLISDAAGAGRVYVLGGASVWTNSVLGRADNAVLASDLLRPDPAARLTVVGASAVGAGDRGLLALIPGRVDGLLWQLVVALAVLAAWRARRLGRPVADGLPVVLPASELVDATGRLLHEGGHRERAAQLLRDRAAGHAGRRLGIPATTPVDTLVSVTAARTGMSPEAVRRALDGPVPADDEALVRLAVSLHHLEEEIDRAR